MTEHRLTIIGFGSLLSEKDARRTCPNLSNFRYGRVPDYARVFGKVDSNHYDYDRDHIANWGFFEAPGHETLVTLFEIPEDEYEALVAREMDYHLKSVKFIELETGIEGQGIACCAFKSNDDFLAHLEKEPLQNQLYKARYHDKYRGDVWRDDLLPCNKYLAFVLSIAHTINEKYIHNILDQSYLGDRKTKVREYLEKEHHNLEFIKNLDWLKSHLKRN